MNINGKASQVADHSLFNIGTPALIVMVIGWGVAEVREGQTQIQQNVIDIAVAKQNIKDNEDDIAGLSKWLQTIEKSRRIQ